MSEYPLLKVKDVARILNVGQRAVRSYVRRGLLPASKLGGRGSSCFRLRIPRESVEEFLRNFRVPAPEK